MSIGRPPKLYEGFSKKQSLKQWGIEYDVGETTLKYRIEKMGMTLEAALEMQLKGSQKYKVFDEYLTLSEASKKYDMDVEALRKRMERGRTLEESVQVKIGDLPRGAKKGEDNPLYKHGLSQDPKTKSTYDIWRSMVRRCTNENELGYEFYGKKGIKPCKSLLNSPESFIECVGLRPDGLTLDRYPNNKGGYWCGECEDCKEHGWSKNIRWATWKQQGGNKINTVLLDGFGQSKILQDWSDEYNIPYTTLQWRLEKAGLSLEDALTLPKIHGCPGNSLLKVKADLEKQKNTT